MKFRQIKQEVPGVGTRWSRATFVVHVAFRGRRGGGWLRRRCLAERGGGESRWLRKGDVAEKGGLGGGG